MVQGSASETEHKIIAILKVLNESSEPLGSITIARELERHGISLSERAVRYHLRITDETRAYAAFRQRRPDAYRSGSGRTKDSLSPGACRVCP